MNINLNDLKELLRVESTTISSFVGQAVIIRTYSAGVHFGRLLEKQGNEVILGEARRLFYWKTNGGLSLSEVSLTGLHDDSKVCAPVSSIWLEAIEIIPCTPEASASILGKKNYVS